MAKHNTHWTVREQLKVIGMARMKTFRIGAHTALEELYHEHRLHENMRFLAKFYWEMDDSALKRLIKEMTDETGIYDQRRPYKGKMSKTADSDLHYRHRDKATGTTWSICLDYDEDTGKKIGWVCRNVANNECLDPQKTLADALEGLDQYLAGRFYSKQWGWCYDPEIAKKSPKLAKKLEG